MSFPEVGLGVGDLPASICDYFLNLDGGSCPVLMDEDRSPLSCKVLQGNVGLGNTDALGKLIIPCVLNMSLAYMYMRGMCVGLLKNETWFV